MHPSSKGIEGPDYVSLLDLLDLLTLAFTIPCESQAYSSDDQSADLAKSVNSSRLSIKSRPVHCANSASSQQWTVLMDSYASIWKHKHRVLKTSRAISNYN